MGERLAPLTGVVFLILIVIGFTIAGEPPGADSPQQEIIDHYVDNKDSIIVASFVTGLGAVFLIFFANHLRRQLAASPVSATILVGAAIVAVGVAIDTTISLALAEAADEIEPTAVQALQALWDNDFIPIALGTLVFLASVGIAILQTAVLPRWLGWIALVLAVVGITPIGWFAAIGAAIWILIVSILLAIRAGRTAAPPSAAGA